MYEIVASDDFNVCLHNLPTAAVRTRTVPHTSLMPLPADDQPVDGKGKEKEKEKGKEAEEDCFPSAYDFTDEYAPSSDCYAHPL